MKKIFFLAVAIAFSIAGTPIFSQSVAINNDGSPANASSMLDIKSTSKGLLIPRMVTSQRTSISSPANGLGVYDTDTKSFWFYSGSAWVEISTGGKGWLLTGNSSTDTSSHFIGTTDNMPFVFKINNLRSGIIDSSSNNTALGFKSLYNNIYDYYTGGNLNTAFGYKALMSNTSGTRNTAIGENALLNSNGFNNTAVGSKALFSDTSGAENTGVGVNALSFNANGNYNTAIGSGSLKNNTTASNNTSIGYFSLVSNTTGGLNTAIGAGAMTYNYSGSNNIAVGMNALFSNLTGSDNTAVGTGALYYNTSSYNTATGYQALNLNSSGSYNTGLGYQALLSNTTGLSNTAVGHHALLNNNANENTGIGFRSLANTTTGYSNTAVGSYSLRFNTTGHSNTAIGNYSLTNNLTGYYNISIGDNSGTNSSYNNTVSIGNDGWLNGFHNQVFIGNASSTWIGGYVGWSTYSDGRIKSNITEDVKGLEFIGRLRPVTYFKNLTEAVALTGNKETKDYPQKYDAEKIKYSGFIAQEVEKAAFESGYEFSGIKKPHDDKDLYTLDYSSFVVPLVKAVQEQQRMIEKQNNIINDLIKRITSLEKKN